MFSFIHAADIHLDSPLKGLEAHEDAPVDEIRGATRMAFVNMIDLAIDEKVDFVLIAGDLYDGDWKDYNTGLFFVKQMGRLDRSGIKVFIVSGNHDAANQITRTMPLPENVTLFSHKHPQSIILEETGAVIHGQGYPSRTVTENLSLEYPIYKPGYFNIGLLHTSLTGRQGHENYAPCTPDDLKSRGYDYWALGHVHKREIVCEEPRIIFPGNIQGRHARETGPKGVALVTVADDNRIIDLVWHDVNVLPWTICNVDMSGCETTESVYNAVRQALEQTLDLSTNGYIVVRLLLRGKCTVHASLFDRMTQWTEEFRAIAAGLGSIWIEKIDFQTSRKVALDEIVGKDTPIAGLLSSIENLEIDEQTLMTHVPDLAALKSKLPPETFSSDYAFDASIDNIDQLRNDVQELLIARLLKHEGDK